MATNQAQRPLKALTAIHLCAMLVLAGGWLYFILDHSPARRDWQAETARQRRRTASAEGMRSALRSAIARTERLSRSMAVDLLLGAGSITLLWVGTRIYVRRLEVWLEARSSGQAMSFGATELSADAIAANRDTGGILR